MSRTPALSNETPRSYGAGQLRPGSENHGHNEHQLSAMADVESGPTLKETEEHVAKTEKKKKAPMSADEVEAKRKMAQYRWKLILGLFGAYALQALDTTVIASALPQIATSFDEIKQLNWIISSFNLTSAAFLFFWAQMADIFGRHNTVQVAIVVMMVGSAICTGAPTSSFGALLLGRSIQGIGCSGVNICVRTILADRVSLAEYASNWTAFVLISGVSFAMGPLIGGYLAKVSWRWCFAINLPISLMSNILIFLLLRKELLSARPLEELADLGSTRRTRILSHLLTIDFGGQMLFLWGLGLLLLALTWGGGTYSWGSAAVLAPLVLGAVISLLWLLYEHSMSPGSKMSRVFPHQRAMMPWKLLSQRDNCLVFLVNFAGGMAMFAVMYFLDLYFTLVEGKSSSKAGLSLLYYMPGLTAGVYAAIFAIKVWPRQTFSPLVLGATATAVGMTVLAWAIHAKETKVVYGMTALIGFGVAVRMNPASVHCLAYVPDMTAQVTCLNVFAIPFGGLCGLTIMSTVFNNKSGHAHEDPKAGIMWAFIAVAPIMWLCVILALFLGNVWILKDIDYDIIRGSFLRHAIAPKRIPKERLSHGIVG